ncbi:sugar transferase [Thalassovita taeanensis]
MQMNPVYEPAQIVVPASGRSSALWHRGLYRIAGKRALDLTLALLITPPVVVILAVLAAVIALDGRSPFYLQKRVGLHGRVFRMWKLRSMVDDADQVLATYLAANPDAKAEWDHTQKLKNDPRITRFGHFIRRTSLDELPQLVNVLKGEMSMVGPRPMMCEQRAIYPGTEYYAMRPGITGFWQTSARNESSFRDRAMFDASYFRKLSLLTDLKVMADTFRVVIQATGH